MTQTFLQFANNRINDSPGVLFWCDVNYRMTTTRHVLTFVIINVVANSNHDDVNIGLGQPLGILFQFGGLGKRKKNPFTLTIVVFTNCTDLQLILYPKQWRINRLKKSTLCYLSS